MIINVSQMRGVDDLCHLSFTLQVANLKLQIDVHVVSHGNTLVDDGILGSM